MAKIKNNQDPIEMSNFIKIRKQNKMEEDKLKLNKNRLKTKFKKQNYDT